jgi:hypothetical protein
MLIKSIILWLIFITVEKTCSWKYYGGERLKKLQESDSPILICLWHGYFIFPMIYLKRHFSFAKVVSSTHKDSMVLAYVLKRFGFDLIKGSSSRGAKSVLKKMINQYKNPKSITIITNDGPKGPPRVAKEGSILLAHKSSVKIVFMSGRSSRFWRLPTWDQFVLPKPFSKNEVYINMIDVPKKIKDRDVGNYVNRKMNQIQDELDNIYL